MSIPEAVVEAVRAARHILVVTGAGVSAESGVPTFREAQTGLWEQFDPHELATPEAFLRDPELIWRWYHWRRELVSRVRPNPGHYALAELARLVPGLTLITQNVDGLHQRAGSEDVVEFHGNLFEDRCFAEGCVVTNGDMDAPAPHCPGCGGLLRPGVVWFGEAIPPQALHTAGQAAAKCDVFLSVGTSSLVWPAAGLGDAARESGAMLIEINPDATTLTDRVHHYLQGKSGEVLPELISSIARD